MSLLVAAAIAAASLVPLNDLGPAPYDYGYLGGLWDNGSNVTPPDHLAAGMDETSHIQPRDIDGDPSPDGKIVFLTLGTSDASAISCYPVAYSCQESAFVPRAQKDPQLGKNVTFVDGTRWGSAPPDWEKFEDYDRIRDNQLTPAGLSEAQVQAAWLLLTSPIPTMPPMPIQFADAYINKIFDAGTLRAMRTRYPNLKAVYISSTVYRGYSNVPEPYGFEAGYTTRFLVVGQVDTMRVADIGPHWDTRMGSLNYKLGFVPWITWGPYLWANGTTPRNDGLTWQRSDFQADGGTLSTAGAEKAAAMLIDFLKHEPTAAAWLGITPAEPPAEPAPSRRRVSRVR